MGASNIASLGLVVAGNLALGNAGTATVLNAGTVGLAASGAVVEVNGVIVANLLNDRRVAGAPASATQILLNGNNTLAALGELAAWGDVVMCSTMWRGDVGRDGGVCGALSADAQLLL